MVNILKEHQVEIFLIGKEFIFQPISIPPSTLNNFFVLILLLRYSIACKDLKPERQIKNIVSKYGWKITVGKSDLGGAKFIISF